MENLEREIGFIGRGDLEVIEIREKGLSIAFGVLVWVGGSVGLS